MHMAVIAPPEPVKFVQVVPFHMEENPTLLLLLLAPPIYTLLFASMTSALISLVVPAPNADQVVPSQRAIPFIVTDPIVIVNMPAI